MTPYEGGVVLDIGTGDGRFVYRSARQHPDKFYIGIDANVQPLVKISERIFRRREKGGAPNVLFLQSAVEELPDELSGIADEVHIQFPWGSLLSAVARGDEHILKGLRRLCRKEARLEILVAHDPKRDASEFERLGIPQLSPAYLKQELVPAYAANGFAIQKLGMIPSSLWPEVESSWAKRLNRSSTRVLFYLQAAAREPSSHR